MGELSSKRKLIITTSPFFLYDLQNILKDDVNYLKNFYDILYGNQYVYENTGKPITEGHMVMGVKDTSISDIVEQLDGTYSIYGENFTKYSKVYINDEKQKSSFLNNTRIDLKESELKDGDVIMVAQVGSSDTIFRTSKKYEYQDGKLEELPADPNDPETGRNAFVDSGE